MYTNPIIQVQFCATASPSAFPSPKASNELPNDQPVNFIVLQSLSASLPPPPPAICMLLIAATTERLLSPTPTDRFSCFMIVSSCSLAISFSLLPTAPSNPTWASDAAPELCAPLNPCVPPGPCPHSRPLLNRVTAPAPLPTDARRMACWYAHRLATPRNAAAPEPLPPAPVLLDRGVVACAPAAPMLLLLSCRGRGAVAAVALLRDEPGLLSLALGTRVIAAGWLVLPLPVLCRGLGLLPVEAVGVRLIEGDGPCVAGTCIAPDPTPAVLRRLAAVTAAPAAVAVWASSGIHL